MRSLDRDRQWVLVSRFEESVPEVDSQGRLTGGHVPVRSRQIPVLATVSAAKGTAETEQFGQSLDYDRTVLIDDPSFEVDESAVLWVSFDVFGALRDGGYFDAFPVYETGADVDGGSFGGEGDDEEGGGFGYPLFTDAPYDHVVRRIARTKHYTALAVKQVKVSA